MAEPVRPEARYTAFLSYSHKDAAAAGRLHRRLEAYRMPKRLAGSKGARGPVPERLSPIFRDREELPAATDLSETVRQALAQSGALIILCSPDAAQSLWVAEEIETFRTLHPDRPILAAILDGDPPDCFPKALRAFGQDGTWHEPLATDLRPGKDGKHLGLLKLVAGITGVGLDALVQRDASRRVRRITILSTIALAAMLLMTGLAVVALNARREAEHQRAEAEGLVEFMLTDLRARLKGRVGQIDVMQAVNERALAHYGRQDPNRLSAGELTRRARILQAIAEDEVLQGNMQAAQTAIRHAHRTTSAQLARAPNDRERLYYHAQSEYWLGRIHELRSEWSAAMRHYTNYASAADRLIIIAPRNPDYMMEVAWSAQNLGSVHLDGTGDIPTAQRLYRKATEWFARASLARPLDLRAPLEQANVHGWLADTYYRQADWQQSVDQRQRQYRIVERLHSADPANVEVAFRFAAAQNGLGRSLDKVGRHEEASRLLGEALAAARGLTRRDPDNAEWLLFRTYIQCAIYYRPQRTEGADRAQLARDIRAATAALRVQGNPQVTSVARCNERLR
jgi:tetratricopeptide (TPR) repeat protein